MYYTSVMSPTVEVLTANYYDDYRFSWAPSTFPSTVEGQAVSYNNQNLPKGLPTGSWTRILSGANDTNGLVSYTLYDAKARAIRSYSTNHIGGHDMVDTQYNFIGDVVKTLAHHQSSSENLDVEDTFSYTAQGRLDKHKQQFDGCTLVTLSENRYDALGQLESKEVGDGLQTVDYKYNVRGWLTDINDIGTLGNDLFAFKISYEGLSNGNISRTQWKTAMDNRARRYDYTYDALNRLLDAEYSSDLGTSSYNESLDYDENGNIIGLLRRGLIEDHELQILMDNLEYTYDTNSNQLLSVYDATGNPGGFDDGNTSGDDYDYDAYGNMVEDANKHITNISYNHLNLPKQITITGLSVAAQGTIDYLYAANGIKLRKKVDAVSGIQIDYVGSFYYEDSSLKFVNHAEGYLKEGRNGWRYVYQYKDHLGNIRLSYSDLDGNGSIDTGSEILEENNYYPFGLKHKGYNNVVNGTDHPYGFGGKEEQNELGLNWIDITARNYDPAIGRWMNLDPLAEQMRRHSPYNYAFDNPIYFMDYDGMAPVEWIKIVNGQKQLVYDPKANGGKGAYTKHASADDKKFGESLRTSGELGESRFNHLVNSDTEITVNFSDATVHSEALGYQMGETKSSEEGVNFHYDENGEIVVDKAEITVYKGTSEKFVHDVKNTAFSTEELDEIQNEDVNTILDNNLDADDMTTATLGHEIDHTKASNVKKQLKEKAGQNVGRNNSEFTPRRTTNQILKDLAEKKKQ